MFKLRETRERTPASMILEPPFNLPFAAADRKPGDPPRWRHMKCVKVPPRIADRADACTKERLRGEHPQGV